MDPKGAKAVLADTELKRDVPLSSANSISLGRLLPQMAYYAHASLAHWRAHRRPLGFVVPTGNLGNALACLLVRRLGLPVGGIVLAGNANQVLAEFFAGGEYRPRPSIPTLANAMDVGAPSNFERVQSLYNSDFAALRKDVEGFAYGDARVIAEIATVHRRHGYVLDPHSAIAWLALQDALTQDPSAHGVFLATAHLAKFREIVEPAIGQPVPLPPELADALSRPRKSISMPAEYSALERFLRS